MGSAQATEILLAAIWRDVLGTENISAASDFFELGGDSLQLMTLLFRISQETGIELDPGIIFEGPTISQIAAVIARMQQSQSVERLEGTL